MLPWPKGISFFAEAHLLLERVRGEGRQQRAAARQDAERAAQRGAAQHRGDHVAEVLARREQARHLGREHLALLLGLGEVGDDLAVAEHAHRHRDEAHAVGEFGNVEGIARHARVDVGADEADQEAQHDHADRLQQRAGGQHHRADQAQHHEREVLGGTELEGQFGQRGREGRKHQRAHAAREEGAEARRRERGAAPPLLGHLVAVDHRHHGGRLARQVDQDRGGRAAVLRAVVDAREHDQRRHGRQRIGRRQQQRHGGHRADAGQHADQRAEQAAEEGIEQVLQREGGAETQREVFEQFHVSCPLNRR
ncbi:hypothetical protein M2165_002197 [Variovorax sp. TBS-050B]|nr:hypothetical protein [Variovorax sp. TBS-050B]